MDLLTVFPLDEAPPIPTRTAFFGIFKGLSVLLFNLWIFDIPFLFFGFEEIRESSYYKFLNSLQQLQLQPLQLQQLYSHQTHVRRYKCKSNHLG